MHRLSLGAEGFPGFSPEAEDEDTFAGPNLSATSSPPSVVPAGPDCPRPAVFVEGSVLPPPVEQFFSTLRSWSVSRKYLGKTGPFVLFEL